MILHFDERKILGKVKKGANSSWLWGPQFV